MMTLVEALGVGEVTVEGVVIIVYDSYYYCIKLALRIVLYC